MHCINLVGAITLPPVAKWKRGMLAAVCDGL